MDININNNVSFGMKPIKSLRRYALKHPDKVIEIDSEKLKKANESIKMALKGLKTERQKARDSAANIFLSI